MAPGRRVSPRLLFLSVAVLVAMSLARCERGAAPDSGFVAVANLSDQEASFHWQSPGLAGTTVLGGSGTEPIAPCSEYDRGFGPGGQKITITAGEATGSFTLAAPGTGQQTLHITIGADRVIAETDAAAFPASPFCTGEAPTASTATPAPTPSLPSSVDGMPLVRLPAGTLTVDVPDVLSPQPGGPPTGPFLYDSTGAKGARLFVVDVHGGSVREIPLPATPRRQSQVALDGDTLVAEIWGHTGPAPAEPGVPCSGDEGQPLAWRLLAARVGADGLPAEAWRTIDTGTAERPYRPPHVGEWCNPTMAPPFAVAAGRIVYAVEASTAGAPEASTVLVRAIADGAVERTYPAARQVTGLALSESTVAWTQSANELIDGEETPDWQLMRATLDANSASAVSPVASETQVWPPGILLDGDGVVVSDDRTVVRVGSSGSATIDPGAPGRDCIASAIDRGLVALGCSDQAGNRWTAVWTNETGIRAIGDPRLGLGPAGFHDGWLFVEGYDYGRQQAILDAIPEAALR